MMPMERHAEFEMENRPHYGDGRAVDLMRAALKAFKEKAEMAYALVRSDDGGEIIGHFLDDAIPDAETWISECIAEGETNP